MLCFIISCSNNRHVSFIAMGDWGRDGASGQKETADQMGKYSEKNKMDFVLTLGDNFYPKGVKSTDDPQWQTSFEKIYTAPTLLVPWYVTIGNHDYGGSVRAQIDYSHKSTRWTIPSRYYSFEKSINDETKALFVIIDTNPFIKSYLTPDKENDKLNENSNSELRAQDTKRQLFWLDSVLTASNAKWKIVAGHHPVYSGGEHGNTPEIIEQVKPILEKNKVIMYLCGHDYDMQYLKDPKSSINYFVAGPGWQLRKAGRNEFTVYTNSTNGFLTIEMYPDKILSAFIDNEGKVLYETEIH